MYPYLSEAIDSLESRPAASVRCFKATSLPLLCVLGHSLVLHSPQGDGGRPGTAGRETSSLIYSSRFCEKSEHNEFNHGLH